MSRSSSGEEHTRKRQRFNHPQQSIVAKKPVKRHDVTSNLGSWSNRNFFVLDTTPLKSLGNSTKDSQNDLFFTPVCADINSWHLQIVDLPPDNHAHPNSVTDIIFPTLPCKDDRQVDLDLFNPFAKHAKERRIKPRRRIVKTNDGEINGYIKIRVQPCAFEVSKPPHNFFNLRRIAPQHSIEQKLLPHEIIPLLPPDFGRDLGLDTEDNNLFTFCKQLFPAALCLFWHLGRYIDPKPPSSDLEAYCRGRTFLTETNSWQSEMPAMAVSEPGVKHGILALAGSYMLDYIHTDSLRRRTDDHYAKVSEFIGNALPMLEHHGIGKSDALVGAISLLIADDEVNWELRRPITDIPNFYRGAILAKSVLDHSDPGYRYWKEDNVQCSKAWAGNANYVAHVCILAEIMAPLQSLNILPEDRKFSWLLWGTKKEVHTIHGVTGLSPKLLHIFAQITRLCYQLESSPGSVFIKLGAVKVHEILQSFRQRSELSEGYQTTDALLESCELDENGKVTNATSITELTGECWVYAAKIYLECRFFRKPLTHPDVRASLDTLICLVKRMPWEGQLFTAQSPFFPIFLMTITSTRSADRAVGGDWFENTVQDNRGRSSVPPVWEAVKLLWAWIDKNMADLNSMKGWKEDEPFYQREAWWESMTTYLNEKIGWMSLT